MSVYPTKTFPFSIPYMRYARPIMAMDIASNLTPVANTCYLEPLEIPRPLTVNAILYYTGAVSAGNVRVGLYADKGDTPAGGKLLAAPAAVAKSAAFNCQRIALTTPLVLAACLIWVAWASDEILSRPQIGTREGNFASPTAVSSFALGGWVALPDPCPAIGASQNITYMWLDVTV